MKGTKLLGAVNDLANSLGVIAKELPKEIKKMEGEISEDDLRKVKKVMERSGFQSKIKEMEKSKKELDELLKDAS